MDLFVCCFSFILCAVNILLYSVIRGRTKECEYEVTGLQNVTMVHTPIPEEIVVLPFKQATHLFLLSVDLNPTIAKDSFHKGLFLLNPEPLVQNIAFS